MTEVETLKEMLALSEKTKQDLLAQCARSDNEVFRLKEKLKSTEMQVESLIADRERIKDNYTRLLDNWEKIWGSSPKFPRL